MTNATVKTNLKLTAVDGAVREGEAAGRTAGGWTADARRFVRNNPAVVLLAAFVIGVALAKAARHA